MGSGTYYRKKIPDRWITVDTIVGIKVLEDTQGNANNLPTYSKTSDAYFKRNKHGEITQMRIFGGMTRRKTRKPVMDIDIYHQNPHNNSDGTSFTEYVVHVHEFTRKRDPKTGKISWKRSKEGRFLTEKEISLYGDILKKANRNIKFK